MKSIIIYASRYGNTRHIAEAIAKGLQSQGTARLLPMEDVSAATLAGVDLVVIGGPTEGHGMTEPVARFLDRMGAAAFQGRAVAAFDTRYRWPRWLSGAASAAITRRLRRVGARVIAPPESFFVAGMPDAGAHGDPALESGETERAATWAGSLADTAIERMERMGRPLSHAV